MEDVDGQSGENAVNAKNRSVSLLKTRNMSEAAYIIPGHRESSS